MDLMTIKALLALTGGPAFAAETDELRIITPEAEALGLRVGDAVAEVLPGIPLPAEGAEPTETALVLAGRCWTLRAARTGTFAVCFLRPQTQPDPGPNENTLLHTAGNIRSAIQDMTTALDALADSPLLEEPEAAHSAALALRSVYRLRRTAGDLERFAALHAGTYTPERRKTRIAAQTTALCGELEGLLRSIGITFTWELPAREILASVDWPLIASLLREMVANAAANAGDGRLRLRLTCAGTHSLRFAVTNHTEKPLPPALFHRHAAAREDVRGGLGLGLSLLSAGAACHGGSFLLSSAETGTVTALLTIACSETEDVNEARSMIQQPADADANLIALSQILSPDQYRLEDLL